MVAKWWPAVVLLLAVSPTAVSKSESKENDAAAVPVSNLSIDPATAKTLTPEQARRLTASAGAVLSLPRLSTISEEAARELATYRKESGTCTHTICVPVQKEKTATYTIMVPFPEEKTKEDGSKVTINKCRPETRTKTYTVTIMVPEERSHVCPLALQLDGLALVKPSVLAALSQHDGHLHLNGMKSLTPDQAKALVPHKGGTLALDGLSSLDAKVAEQLAAREGGLSLNGLTALSLDTAKALCTHKGDLNLDGLAALEDDLAVVIAKHEGSASLRGVKEASEQAITALRGKPVALPSELLTANKKEVK
jgi:hypothetical protein